MKKIIILCSAFLFPIFAQAGYGNTKWGMNPEQVVEAEKGKAKIVSPIKYKNGEGKVQIENMNIASDDYTVTFIFDGEDRLVQANLISNEKKNAGIAASRFDSLHQLLTQKYGEPNFKGADSISWKSSDTIIELKKIVIPGVIAQTSVRYIPSSKIEVDTSNL